MQWWDLGWLLGMVSTSTTGAWMNLLDFWLLFVELTREKRIAYVQQALPMEWVFSFNRLDMTRGAGNKERQVTRSLSISHLGHWFCLLGSNTRCWRDDKEAHFDMAVQLCYHRHFRSDLSSTNYHNKSILEWNLLAILNVKERINTEESICLYWELISPSLEECKQRVYREQQCEAHWEGGVPHVFALPIHHHCMCRCKTELRSKQEHCWPSLFLWISLCEICCNNNKKKKTSV